MRRLSEIVFCTVCFSFAAVLLVLSLLGAVRLASLSDEDAGLEQELETLKDETRALRVTYDSMLQLDEIERYAVEELGLQHCSPGQIVYIDPVGAGK